MTSVDLLLGCTAVHGELGHARDSLEFQSTDALHEKLVQVRAGDRQEFQALEQRIPIVVGLGQHASVESQPGQLPIEIQGRPGQVDVLLAGGWERGRCAWRQSCFRPSPILAACLI